MTSPSESQPEELEVLLLEASREVDRTLIQWALALSPLDRLRAATSSAASLEALRSAKQDDGRRR
ncbi:MAG: hypothetical protein WBN30_17955 [Polyangiales bacterium]